MIVRDMGGLHAFLDRDDDLSEAAALVRRYSDLGIGLADASVVVLASKYRTIGLLCTDEGHFRAVSPFRGGGAFRLLPADA